MKKSLVALAALSAISAFADVDVSGGIKLYGVLDQAYMTQSWASSAAAPAYYTNSGMFAAGATSRLGVKGSRDLGNDFKGIFQIEIELNPDSNADQGGLLPQKNRGTFVGLERKNVGSIRLGTQETTAYELFAMDVNGRVEYKPQVWRYTASKGQQDRAGNAIKLTSEEFSGFKASFMTAPAEDGLSTGNTALAFKSFGLNFHQENIRAAVVLDSINNQAGEYRMPGSPYEGLTVPEVKNASGDKTQTGNQGGKTTYAAATPGLTLDRKIAAFSYDAGVAKLVWIYADSGNSKGSLSTNTFGVRVPYNDYAFAVSYGSGSYQNNVTASTYGTVSDTTLGAYYNFDKSTSFYMLTSKATNQLASYAKGYTNSTAIGLQYKF